MSFKACFGTRTYMTDFLFFMLAGLLSGVFGGMGMGGGTVLIPVLTVFFNVGQRAAQAANLISFIPMAAIASVINYRSGIVKKEGLVPLVIPAVVFAVGMGFLAAYMDELILKKIFGGFLIVTGGFAFFADKIKFFGQSKAKS